MKRRFNKLAVLLLGIPIGAAAETATRARFLMGTVCEITAHGPAAGKAIEAAFEEIAAGDRVMSLFKEDSELSVMNRRATAEAFPASNALFEVLHIANEVHRFSGGAFDPTVERGAKAPGFAKVVKLDPDRRTVEFFGPRVRVDLNGIGKGYALDAAASVLRARGINSALLNFGGQVLAVGTQPGREYWDVGIENTDLVLRVRDRSVATSSQGQQKDHVVDPRTGKPVARRGSVTVVAKDGARADAWSTAIFVLGAAKAPETFEGCAIETSGGKVVAQSKGCKSYIAKTTKSD